MNPDFLLKTETAQRLFDAVKELPVIDWHNHLSVKDLTEDRRFENLTRLWVGSDPYKHRAMRICGVPEKFITGQASPREKFQAWSTVLPLLAGNPLYHWSQLELKRVFGVEEGLNESSAERIWRIANEKLSLPAFSARGILKRFSIEYASPCAAIGDDLKDFSGLEGFSPSLRGDDLFLLSSALFKEAETLPELCAVLRERVKKFHDAGCRFADYALDAPFSYVPEDGKNAERFVRFKRGTLPEGERRALSWAVLRFLASLYGERNWTMQLHIGALRATSSRLRQAAGPAGGYAGIGAPCDTGALAKFLDDLEESPSGLPRTILYTLNPADHAPFAVLSGSFPGEGEQGKVTLGPAWWYCDHIHGMRDCFENAAAFGVLSVFPGMTTDSRSLLSFVRHEYFRRVFCAWLAEKAARDEMPSDFGILKDLAEKVCYYNAKAIINN